MSKAAHTHPTAPLRIIDLMPELVAGIAGHIPAGALLPFACTSKQCLEAAKAVHDSGVLRTHPRWMCESVSLVEWALKEPKVVTFGSNLLRRATRLGNLPVLIWLNDYDDEDRLDETMFWNAAKSGNIEVVKWFNAKGFQCNTFTFETAAANARFELLEWLLDQECPHDKYACLAAACCGRVEVLKWLCDKGNHLTDDTFDFAAGGGQIHVLEWLLSKLGRRWTEHTCWCAAVYGRTNALQWLRARGCWWDKSQCEDSASNEGHDETVKWIRTQPED